MTSYVTAVGNTTSVKQQEHWTRDWMNSRNRKHPLSVNTRPKPLSIHWEEVKGHRPGVSGRSEKDQGGHSHLTPEIIFEQRQRLPSPPIYNHLLLKWPRCYQISRTSVMCWPHSHFHSQRRLWDGESKWTFPFKFFCSHFIPFLRVPPWSTAWIKFVTHLF